MSIEVKNHTIESQCTLTCSKSCDTEKHIKHGFSLSSFTNFTVESTNELDDSIKEYIAFSETIF